MIADWQANCVFLAAMLKDRHRLVFAQLQQILLAHGIGVYYLEGVRDIWARDYCPVQVGPGKLVKFRYDPDYLKEYPHLRTGAGVVKSLHGIGSCRRSEIIIDGGNIVASGTQAILTDKIYKENPDWSRSSVRDQLQKLMRVDQLIVIPKEPFDLFGHTDAMVRFIDEQTVLVNDYSGVDPGFNERLSKVLRRHQLAIEPLPYFQEKRSKAGIQSAVGCFTNYLRTEKVLVAPTYGMKKDYIALRKLESVFPGLPIVQIDCTDLAREGGVLNCIAATYNISPHIS